MIGRTRRTNTWSIPQPWIEVIARLAKVVWTSHGLDHERGDLRVPMRTQILIEVFLDRAPLFLVVALPINPRKLGTYGGNDPSAIRNSRNSTASARLISRRAIVTEPVWVRPAR
jgi:hypothetical protein